MIIVEMEDNKITTWRLPRRLLSATDNALLRLPSITDSIAQLPAKLRESTFRKQDADLAALECYRYHALRRHRHIRVLILHPGTGDEEIYCTLEVALLDRAPAYEALSYAWGDSKDIKERHAIRCGNGRFNIMPNLFEALKRLRDSSARRVLWIDAICINQHDDEEKSFQVQQMSEIYSSASRVLIWLGEETESVPAAFEAIRLTRLLFPEEDAQANAEAMSPNQIQFYEQRHFDYVESGEMVRIFKMFEPVMELLSRPWFSRKWIVQEVVRGRNSLIVCGSHTLSWSILEETFSHMRFLGMEQYWRPYFSDAELTCFNTVTTLGTLRIPSVTTMFAQLVRETRRLKATVPRDHLISMVASDLNPDDVRFIVNYSIPTTTEYLMRFMEWSVQTKRTLNFLSSGFEQADVVDPTQPSWIFDVTAWDHHGGPHASTLYLCPLCRLKVLQLRQVLTLRTG
ncbi:hypothetical protein ONS95_008537 [Cadophora gregata]|uniref:uncharacterized protein n=1 Tax=Cadophora gregata TaxID=51156 RepID=UPI0026DCFAC8|nr:uncharacterized protein ONS95_008537 [Cadophora gregata]KAK0100199.1 hypothetical protein ONS95_008537 [Cadophora gregata]KAK0114852.1 hypothetical protein ONS96_013333 [Cadophora gregata f. sp. sojae]